MKMCVLPNSNKKYGRSEYLLLHAYLKAYKSYHQWAALAPEDGVRVFQEKKTTFQAPSNEKTS